MPWVHGFVGFWCVIAPVSSPVPGNEATRSGLQGGFVSPHWLLSSSLLVESELITQTPCRCFAQAAVHLSCGCGVLHMRLLLFYLKMIEVSCVLNEATLPGSRGSYPPGLHAQHGSKEYFWLLPWYLLCALEITYASSCGMSVFPLSVHCFFCFLLPVSSWTISSLRAGLGSDSSSSQSHEAWRLGTLCGSHHILFESWYHCGGGFLPWFEYHLMMYGQEKKVGSLLMF